MEEPDEFTPLLSSASLRSRSLRRRVTENLSQASSGSRRREWPSLKNTSASRCAAALIASPWFEPVLTAVVVANAVAIYFEIDHPYVLDNWAWVYLIVAFNAIYTAEIGLYVTASGWVEFLSDTFNVFSLLVTLAAWLEISTTLGFAVLFMRHWRSFAAVDLVQVLRLVRVLRLAVVAKHMAQLVDGLMNSIRALLWFMVFAFLFFFMCACFFTVLIGRGDFHGELALQDVQRRFNTILFSMYSLFEISTIEGWTDFVRPFLDDHVGRVLFFIAFICMANFFVLNLLTAVVVEKVLVSTGEQDANRIHEQEGEKARALGKLHKRLLELNEGQNLVHRQELTSTLQEDAVAKNLMTTLGWSPAYVTSLCPLCESASDMMVSLSSLNTLCEDLSRPLSMRSYARWQHSIGARADGVDQLLEVILKSASNLKISRTRRILKVPWKRTSTK